MSIASKVELSIACKNLKDLDYFSKSDPLYSFMRELVKFGKNWIGVK